MPSPTGPPHIVMRSIYHRVLGDDFNRLHPMIQKRFGFNSGDREAAIGRGTMERIWHGSWFTLPFLYAGTWRSIMFPECAEAVPFTIENFAYRDSFGRETVTWVRTFQTRKPRRFDAYMISSEQRALIVDYLGTHQHLAVDLHLSVEPNGGLRLRSGEQRFYEGAISFRFPMIFSGLADVCEWYDEASAKFRISVCVTNPRWGPLFGYDGAFEVEWLAADEIPSRIRPKREEPRE